MSIMYCGISESFRHCLDEHSTGFISGVKKIPSFLGEVDQATGTALGIVAVGIYPIVRSCESAARKTTDFVKNNWHQLIGYLISWAVIVTCSGILYGFDSVALPLMIGLGGGELPSALSRELYGSIASTKRANTRLGIS